MHSALTSEQRLFAEAVGRFVDQEYGRGPAKPTHSFNRDRLRRLGELGCLSLAIPVEFGGLGGPIEAMIAIENLAPGLPQEPVLACNIYAASLIAAVAPAPVAEKLSARIAVGDLIVAVAHSEERARYDLSFIETVARRSGERFILSGAKSIVAHAPIADLLIVSAREEMSNEVMLFLVDPEAAGVTVTPHARLDGVSSGNVRFDSFVVSRHDRLDAAPAEKALAKATDLAEAAQVAEMVGLMNALVSATVDYSRTRKQFGAAIGSFQAVQHRIADMWMACEETRSLAYAAALACNAPVKERQRFISIAKIRACDAASLVGAAAIQLHGGVGMTDELIVGRWYRRLLALKASLGDRRHHLKRLAAMSMEIPS